MKPEEILMEIHHMSLLKELDKLNVGPHRRNKEKYCLYHDDHGRSLGNAFDLMTRLRT